MRIEILCTGDELLDGSVVDTNSAYFCGEAFARGVRVLRKDTVPDDLEAIAAALALAGSRSDFVLVSGGLGPTSDDLTAEAAAKAAGVPLVEDAGTLARLKERLRARGLALTPNNARQALVPKGATVVPNAFGSAPMFVLQVGRAQCCFLPGVPKEFKGLCDTEVLPRLEQLLAREQDRTFRATRVLKTVGLPESQLDALVRDLRLAHPDVRFGFRTHAPENHLKLAAEAPSAEAAAQRLAEVEAKARALLGDRLFGADDARFAVAVVDALKRAKATVALAESCTGGRCAAELTSVAGASDVLAFSAVVYQERAKTALLGVDPATLAAYSAVSPEVTRTLATQARARVNTTFGLAITGWAGPTGGTERDPLGTVYIALSHRDGVVEQRHQFFGDRARVQLFAAAQALDVLRLEARRLSP